MVDKQRSRPAEKNEPITWKLALAWTIQYCRELLDFRFNRYLIVQVLPGVYVLLLLSLAVAIGFFMLVSFQSSLWSGLYVLLASPVIFIVGASIIRGILELYRVAFRISENLDELVGIRDTVDRLSGIGETVDQMVSVARFFPFGQRRQSHKSDSNTDKKTDHDKKS